MKNKIKNGCLTVIVILIALSIVGNMINDKKSNTINSSKITKSSKTTKKSSDSSKQEVKNDGKEYDKKSNSQFADYLSTELNDKLSASGYQVRVEYYDFNLIYVFVPQELKYDSKSNIQQSADTILTFKNELFNSWAIENGYDLNYTTAPSLYVKANDGTVLAEENAINHTMKLT